MKLSLLDVGMITIGALSAVLVVIGIACAIVVLADEFGKRRASIRQRRARTEAQRRYRVPTQR